jgi:hypothetical protein
MNRKGLWAGGLALILVVVGAAALLTPVGAGYAKDEDDSSSAKSRGRICSPRMGSKSRAMIRGRSPLQAMMSLTATVRSKASLRVTLMGRFFVRSPSLARIRSRRIAQAPSPLRVVPPLRRATSSSPLMALSSRSCVPTPRVWGQRLTSR